MYIYIYISCILQSSWAWQCTQGLAIYIYYIISYYTYVYICIFYQWIGLFCGKILTGNHRFSHEDHGDGFPTIQLSPTCHRPRLFQELCFRLPHRRHGLIQPEKNNQWAGGAATGATQGFFLDVYIIFLLFYINMGFIYIYMLLYIIYIWLYMV